MSNTVIPFGDKRAVKRWSGNLFVATKLKSYWERKFVGTDENAVIQRLTDLESAKGDTISFDLSIQLRQAPVKGDTKLVGREENLRFASDEVTIDQLRHGVTTGGAMSRKRTEHDMRSVGKNRLSDYWAAYFDELTFMYLSGERGVNNEFIEDLNFVGTAKNELQSPDDAHLLYGGDATSHTDLAADDIMSRAVIERATVKARMMRTEDPDAANMVPVMINGEGHYVCVMSTFQEHDMRNNDQAGWLEIQKAAMAAEGKSSPIFKGGLGMINNVVLHSHERAIRLGGIGAGGKVQAARALFLGSQAGVIAYGSTKGLRFTWTEEIIDHGNDGSIASGVILGIKKTRFNDTDFGVIALDTAAKDPNAKAA
ncbi:N4-gp56 family major capsid protein (plasmid) [Brucella anthropi]|uniref:N4-gp56 family major capsid protein n=1 Tax=Brucella anthropi TaxID=529 RepID=UPI001BCE4364